MSSDEEDSDCPLCMEELDIADRNFRPCPCGYQICRFCWHHIKTNLNGRCPACRRLYSDQIVEFVPVSAEEIMRLKKEKKEKDRQTREMRDPSRRQLSNVRVVQKNLVYILGLGVKHASVDNELFKKYGRIDKVVISKRSAPAPGSNSSVGIYVTFTRKEDAGKAIEGLNGMEYDGKTLRASYGTTKYCTYYLRHMSCPNPNCMYLHEPGDDVDSYNKDIAPVSAIGKHANPSVSSSSTSAYPNKRPATAATPLRPSASTTTATTPEPKPATVPRTWAPIPKVVPIPPVVIPKEEEPIVAAPPSPPFKEIVKPSASTKKTPVIPSASTSTVVSSRKAAKKPAVEKPKKMVVPLVAEEDERPALPATASWAKTQPVINHESVITPANFGPSLSDALNAPQKPKHSPSLKVKKEKKTKGKMVRLEEFEEAEREAKLAASRPKVVPKPVVEVPVEQLAPPVVDEPKDLMEIVEQEPQQLIQQPIQQQPEQQPEVPAAAESSVLPHTAVVEEKKPEVEDEVKLVEQETVEPEMMEIKKTSIPEEESIVKSVDVMENQVEKQDEQLVSGENDKKVNDSKIDVSQAVEEVREEVEDDLESDDEKVEGLATLNDDIIKAFDHAAQESSEKVQADQDNSDILSEHESTIVDQVEQPQKISSPMAAMDRLSALVQQEIMTDSPEPPQFEEPRHMQQQHQPQHQPQQQQQSHPGMNRFDMGMPIQRSPMPPPGLGAPPPPPPDWMGRSFDPFNGQDPSLIAARRLQHSQRMLEASGLFAGGGFGQPPLGPRFGFHPPPPPPPNGFHPHHQPPPPGMFPPPPPHMMRPDMMNMQSPMQSPFPPPPPQHPLPPPSQMQMEELRNDFGAMKMGMEDQSREDLRALLPNVNISFNNLQEKRRAEEFYQQQLLMRQQQQIQRMSEQGDIPSNSPLRHQEKVLTRSSPGPSVALPNHYKPIDEENRNNPDVRVEAQNFFGEFLRKAASSTPPQPEMSPKQEEPASLPFQDPAIMSVRLMNNNEVPMNDAIRSQNTILQILGGQPPPQSPLMTLEQQQLHHHQQQHRQQQQQQQQQQHQLHMQQQQQQHQQMHQFHQQRHQQQQQQQQRQMDPRFGGMDPRMMHQDGQFNDMGHKPFNNMFMGGPPPPNFPHQQQAFHNQQQQPQQQQQPSNFMHGFREPNMNMMGRMGPPPGMMRPPMPPPLNDMRFRNGPMGNPPPGMFSSEEGRQ